MPPSSTPQPTKHITTARRNLLAALIPFVLILTGTVLWPTLRVNLQAIAVLDLVANRHIPKPIRWLATQSITTSDLTLPLPSGTIRARLYTPAHHPNAPAILILHGVHHLGMNEPRLISFASAIASCGLRVLTPELPGISDYQVGPGSITTIGQSATWLSSHQDHHTVGIIGLSFSGSLALLAAASPNFRTDIKFVVAIGAEDQMNRVAYFYISGKDLRPDGSVETLPPHEYGPLVLEYEHLEEIVPPTDLAPIRSVLRAHLYEDPAAERSALAILTPSQTAEAEHLMDTASPTTRNILAHVNDHNLPTTTAVSPHGHLSHLTTPVYLLHGAADNIVPSAETLWLASELPRKSLKASLISPVISHLDLDGKSPTLLDQLRLIHFFALILQAAESH